MKFLLMITLLMTSSFICSTASDSCTEIKSLFDKLSLKTQQTLMQMSEYFKLLPNISDQNELIQVYYEQNKESIKSAMYTDGILLRKLVKDICNKGKDCKQTELFVKAACYYLTYKDEL
jgi:hypothetical protein